MNINKKTIEHSLLSSYESLSPYSKKYKVDFKRYLFTLNLILSTENIKNKNVLDIGTGIAILPLTLKRLSINAKGLDYYIFPDNQNEMFSIDNIKEIKSVWVRNRLNILNESIYNIPETLDSSFDVVISEATIEHLKDPKKLIDNCHRILRNDGYLIISTPNISTLLKRLRFLFGKSPNWPIKEFYLDGENFTGHWREYTIDELAFMCEQSGFEIVKKYNKNFLASFKNITQFRKNFRAIITLLSNLIPGSREMNYILCKKK